MIAGGEVELRIASQLCRKIETDTVARLTALMGPWTLSLKKNYLIGPTGVRRRGGRARGGRGGGGRARGGRGGGGGGGGVPGAAQDRGDKVAFRRSHTEKQTCLRSVSPACEKKRIRWPVRLDDGCIHRRPQANCNVSNVEAAHGDVPPRVGPPFFFLRDEEVPFRAGERYGHVTGVSRIQGFGKVSRVVLSTPWPAVGFGRSRNFLKPKLPARLFELFCKIFVFYKNLNNPVRIQGFGKVSREHRRRRGVDTGADRPRNFLNPRSLQDCSNYFVGF